MRSPSPMPMASSKKKRKSVPCESDEHVFRPEVYDADEGATWIEDECCTICGWTWSDIADHDRGDCCCPASHAAKSLERR